MLADHTLLRKVVTGRVLLIGNLSEGGETKKNQDEANSAKS
jgi:hypothetical protein